MYKYIRTSEEFMRVIPVLEQYVNQQGSDKPRIALDVETYGPDKEEIPKATRRPDGTYNGYIRTLQIGLDPDGARKGFHIFNEQWVIDVKELGAAFVGKHLKNVLEKATVLGQNLKYEYQFFKVHLGIDLRNMVDLMLISQCLYAGDKVHHGLGDLYARFLDYGWFESYARVYHRNSSWYVKYLADIEEAEREGKRRPNIFDAYKKYKEAHQAVDWEIDDISDEGLQYAADDVTMVFPVLEAQFEKLDLWRRTYEQGFPKERGIIQVIKLECNLIPVFAMMELRGVRLDVDYHRNTVIKYLEAKRDEAIKKVGFVRTVKVKKSNGLRGLKRVVWEEEVEEPLNLRSWQQLKPKLNELLKEALGDEVNLDKTSEDAIRDTLNKYTDPDHPDNPEHKILPEELQQKIRHVLQYKKAASLLSKYGQTLVDQACGCGTECDTKKRHYIYPSWYQIGTDELAVDSGRSSCRNPNMMNIPSRGVLWVTRWGRDDKGKEYPILFHDTLDYQDGINVTQFFRRSFVAEDGWVLLDFDYSQEEPRIAAEYCNEKALIDAYNAGKADIHGIIGQALMDLRDENGNPAIPKKGSYERDYIGKTAGLSLLYGIHWKSLKAFMYSKTDGKVKWTEKDAEDAYNNFFSRFPNIRRKMDEVAEKMRQKAEEAGFSLAPFKKDRRPFAVAYTFLGRARRFCLKHPDQTRRPDHELSKSYKEPLKDKKGEIQYDEDGKMLTTHWNVYRERLSAASREGFNHAIQGTAADILKVAILEIHERFKEAGFGDDEGIIAVIHDEILVHVRQEHAEEAKKIMEECMVAAGGRFLKRVPITVDGHEALNWAAAKS